ncbi:MAG: ubiquinol-cytochrome c reductase iron-sulfur subunit [OM182 bacterium]|nr:MAG: ubiquinol-cytochrome c reductase iron-sulfur subunit [OM182 bacterium]HBK17345.1 ubiquinol-cytochrome c reductase iron-sulfur subunit [Gammaproteobacteria bacterium]
MSDGDVVRDASQEAGEAASSSRRYFLIQATSAVGAVGAVGAAWPFVMYWTPSAKARALGAPVRVDVSKLAPGEMLSPIVAWRGKPIFIVARDKATIDALKVDTAELADPDSVNPEQQPDFAANAWRSERPEIGVYLGICTHLGCSPKHVVSNNFEDTGQGGFFCPCHGSKFDLAGRVVKGVPAPDNLEVPPYRFESDSVIIIG